ncbi:MAG: hypothetical protein ACFFEX_08665 [Candidatus Thorarchaeota archaeon]
MVRLTRLEIQELNYLKRVNKIQIGNWNHNMNVVRHNPGRETMKHFLVKAAIAKMILDAEGN